MEFSKAYNRLKEINNILQSGQVIDIQQIVDLQKEAEELYKICKDVIIKFEENSNWK